MYHLSSTDNIVHIAHGNYGVLHLCNVTISICIETMASSFLAFHWNKMFVELRDHAYVGMAWILSSSSLLLLHTVCVNVANLSTRRMHRIQPCISRLYIAYVCHTCGLAKLLSQARPCTKCDFIDIHIHHSCIEATLKLRWKCSWHVIIIAMMSNMHCQWTHMVYIWCTPHIIQSSQ